MIPFVDLKAQYATIKEEIDTAIHKVLDETSFIGGSLIQIFEKNFGAYIGIKHCIGCANGTDSIEILLNTLGVGPGDEVIVPAISWISTSESVSAVGARPVFVDIDPDYYTIDLSLIEAKITNKTKAIIPVHLYGQTVDMIQLMAIAKKHNLKVLEDCAQAHGAEFEGQKVGTFGDCASFSFYPGKNLGAYGDAGCMVTNDDTIAEMARMIANHGQQGKHNHLMEGRNSRLDGIHAAVLDVKLKYIEQWTSARINIAEMYSNLLSDSSIETPKTVPGGKHVFHLYVIRVENRDRVQKQLAEREIGTAIHYPTALPFLHCYASYGHTESDFPVAHSYQNQILSLPMFPELSEKNTIEITAALKEIV